MILYNEQLKTTKIAEFAKGEFFCVVTANDVLLIKVKSTDYKTVNGLILSINHDHLNTGREGFIWKHDIIEYRECSTAERAILEKHLKLVKYFNILDEELNNRKLKPVDTATKVSLNTIKLILNAAKENR